MENNNAIIFGVIFLILVLGKKIWRLVKFSILLLAVIIAFQNIGWVLKTIYPIHYRDLVEKYAQVYDIDPYLVVAIMRNESKFDPNALSRKDAKGLMQVAPITGKWASEKLEIKNYTEDRLFEPELNIQMGVWYLGVLKKEFGDNIPVIIAGYNAGNGNVKKWLEDPTLSRDGKTLNEIPFNETKIYQKKVLRDYKIYSEIYNRY